MRKFYLHLFNLLRNKAFKVIGISLLIFAFHSVVIAQTWNGSISSNILTTDNWTPATALSATTTTVNLTIPLTPMVPTNNLFKNPPTISGAQNIAINTLITSNVPDSIDTNGDSKKDAWATIGKLIVNLDTTFEFKVNATSIWYGAGGVQVKSGRFYSRRGMRLDLDSSRVIVENKGILAVERDFMFWNNNTTTPTGGKLYIKDNGKVTSTVFPNRFYLAKRPQIIITENGKMEVNGNWDCKQLIKDTLISGLPNYYPISRYDGIANKTYLSAVPNNLLKVSQTANQILTAGETGTIVSVVTNQAWADCDPASFQWKYATTPGGPYVAFSTPVLNDTIYPKFSVSGTLYLVCQGIKISDGSTLTTNEVTFVVGSGKLTFAPSGNQFLRVGQSGTPIVVTETGTSTAREWKYSNVSGGPYVSFASPETGTSYIPNFAAPGDYYVQLESTIDGIVEKGKEIFINYVAWTAGARALVWTGTTDSIMNRMINWNPFAYPTKNSMTVNAVVAPAKYPYYKVSGKDTLGAITVNANAKLTFARDIADLDTLQVRGEFLNYDGTFTVESGVINFPTGYFRTPNNNSRLYIKNNSTVICGNVFFWSSGDAATQGGKAYLTENAKLIYNVWPGRITTSTAAGYKNWSVLQLKSQAENWWKGDATTRLLDLIKRGKIVADTLTTDTLSFFYDSVSDYTRVYVYDTLKFRVTPHSRAFVSRNQKVNFEALNTTGLSNLKWYYRYNIKDGKNIDNANAWTQITDATGATASIGFAAPGDYFIMCSGNDGAKDQFSVNVGKIKVVGVVVTPAAKQSIKVENKAATLTRIAPVKSVGEWKYTTTAGIDYVSFDPAVSDTFLTADFSTVGIGTFFIAYETSVNNDEAKPVTVYSNEVEIEVTEDVGFKPLADDASLVYPNPNKGEFKVVTGNNGPVTVQIMDITGKVVFRKQYNQSGSIDINFNKRGTFVVKVTTAKGVKVSRLVIK